MPWEGQTDFIYTNVATVYGFANSDILIVQLILNQTIPEHNIRE
jgi:hypothetical protein